MENMSISTGKGPVISPLFFRELLVFTSMKIKTRNSDEVTAS